jgi:hypothetical protein
MVGRLHHLNSIPIPAFSSNRGTVKATRLGLIVASYSSIHGLNTIKEVAIYNLISQDSNDLPVRLCDAESGNMHAWSLMTYGKKVIRFKRSPYNRGLINSEHNTTFEFVIRPKFDLPKTRIIYAAQNA